MSRKLSRKDGISEQSQVWKWRRVCGLFDQNLFHSRKLESRFLVLYKKHCRSTQNQMVIWLKRIPQMFFFIIMPTWNHGLYKSSWVVNMCAWRKKLPFAILNKARTSNMLLKAESVVCCYEFDLIISKQPRIHMESTSKHILFNYSNLLPTWIQFYQ